MMIQSSYGPNVQSQAYVRNPQMMMALRDRVARNMAGRAQKFGSGYHGSPADGTSGGLMTRDYGPKTGPPPIMPGGVPGPTPDGGGLFPGPTTGGSVGSPMDTWSPPLQKQEYPPVPERSGLFPGPTTWQPDSQNPAEDPEQSRAALKDMLLQQLMGRRSR